MDAVACQCLMVPGECNAGRGSCHPSFRARRPNLSPPSGEGKKGQELDEQLRELIGDRSADEWANLVLKVGC
jgi:hypothetical protein